MRPKAQQQRRRRGASQARSGSDATRVSVTLLALLPLARGAPTEEIECAGAKWRRRAGDAQVRKDPRSPTTENRRCSQMQQKGAAQCAQCADARQAMARRSGAMAAGAGGAAAGAKCAVREVKIQQTSRECPDQMTNETT